MPGTIQFAASPNQVMLVGIAAVAILILLTLLLHGRKTASRALVSFVAHAVAIFSLCMLFLRPQIEQSVANATGLLVTPGSAAVDIESISDSLGMAGTTFVMADSGKPGITEAIQIPDAGMLKRRRPEITRLYLAGHGLSRADINRLQPVQLVPLPARLPPGIRHISSPRWALAGDRVQISGRLEGAEFEGARLMLFNESTLEDSTTADERGRFGLHTSRLQKGTHLLRIEARNPAGTSNTVGRIGIDLAPPAKRTILLLEGAPSFETRHLKRYLAKQVHAVAIRTKISAMKFRETFVGMQPRKLAPITARVLSGFDIIVLERRVATALTRREWRLLESRVAVDGAGLLLLDMPGSEGKSALIPAQFRFNLQDAAEEPERQIRPALPGSAPLSARMLPAGSAVLQLKLGDAPVVLDQNEAVLVASRAAGSGRVAVSLLQETFRWVLNGESESHAALWAEMLRAVGPQPARGSISLAPAGPLIVNEPMEIIVDSPGNEPVLFVGAVRDSVEIRVPLRQDLLLQERWHGRYWPRQIGWHTIRLADGVVRRVLVHPDSEWRTVQAARKMMATGDAVARQAVLGADGEPARVFAWKDLPPLYFFLSFLAAMAVLWIEPKLS